MYKNFLNFIIYLFIYLLTLQYCIGFAIHQPESTMSVHVFPILNPPHTILLGHPSAPAPSILYLASNLDWCVDISCSGFDWTRSTLEKAMAPHSSTLAWKIPWTEEPARLQSMASRRRTQLRDFTFTFHFHALEKEMTTHSSVLARRIPGTLEPGGLLSVGSHRVGHET